MSAPTTAGPNRRRLPHALATLLLATGVAHAGTFEDFVTVQAGAFNDPAVWDLGYAPSSATEGSFAWVKHDLVLDEPGAVGTLFVGVGGSAATLDLQGGSLEVLDASIGRSGRGTFLHTSGTTTFEDWIIVGSSQDGDLVLYDGSLTTQHLYVGGFPGSTGTGVGTLALLGGDGTLTATGDVTVSDVSMIVAQPVAEGAPGLTTVSAGTLTFEPGAQLFVDPGYNAEVGDGWDIAVSGTPIVGLPTLVQFSSTYEMTLDTSDPNVLRVVVTDSPFPVWTDLGGGSPGVNGVPQLDGTGGPLVDGNPVGLELSSAPASSAVLLIGSLTSAPVSALGGTVHAYPWTIQLFAATNAVGELSLGTTWPAAVPPGTDLFIQAICQDPTVADGLTLSNGIQGTTPN